jgi:hypothetical protein
MTRAERPALRMTIATPGLHAVVTLDDVRVESGPVEWLRSLLASKPDPAWRYVDGAGHEHRWTITEAPPMAGHGPSGVVETCEREWRHVPCDGSCGAECGNEGYSVTVWRCRSCGEVLDPGPRYVPDYRGRTSGYPIYTGPATVSFRTPHFGGMPGLGVAVRATLAFDDSDPASHLDVEVAPDMIERQLGGLVSVKWRGYVIAPEYGGPDARTSGGSEVRR